MFVPQDRPLGYSSDERIYISWSCLKAHITHDALSYTASHSPTEEAQTKGRDGMSGKPKNKEKENLCTIEGDYEVVLLCRILSVKRL